jgi:hypothetical protein
MPAGVCKEIDSSKEHCDGLRNFQGGWMLPIEADDYYGRNFRFSPGMTGWYICYDAGFSLDEVAVEIDWFSEIQGATALATATAAIIFATLY